METVYWILFGVGIVMAVVTILFGDVFEIATGSVPYLSPSVIAAFMTVFGGTGAFLTTAGIMAPIPSAFISFIVSIALTLIMLFTIILQLHRAQKSAAYSSKDMIGKLAEVITPIEQGKKGEIIYEQGGCPD